MIPTIDLTLHIDEPAPDAQKYKGEYRIFKTDDGTMVIEWFVCTEDGSECIFDWINVESVFSGPAVKMSEQALQAAATTAQIGRRRMMRRTKRAWSD
jgi:hypothetical protein